MAAKFARDPTREEAAAIRTLVTVEAVREASLLEDPALAAGTIPALYVDRICEAPGGMQPLGVRRAGEVLLHQAQVLAAQFLLHLEPQPGLRHLERVEQVHALQDPVA